MFHDLRHTFTTNARRAGVLEKEIMAIVTGHSSRSTFDRYNTVDEDDIRRTMDRVQSYLATIHQTIHQLDQNGPKELSGTTENTHQ